jgi:hypothetical protein
MLSLGWFVRLQAYGIVALHVFVLPDPVATTAVDSPYEVKLVVPSAMLVLTWHVIFVRLVVLRVIVIVTVIVPVNVVAALGSASSATA